MKVAAFFDMDGTLLSVNSGARYLHLLWRLGQITPSALARGFLWVAQYKLGIMDGDRVVSLALNEIRGQAESEMIERCRTWFREELRETIFPGARGVLERHRKEGHTLVLLTSATWYAAAPLCEELDIPHILCTRLEVKDGCFTGRYLPPLCYGKGKVKAAEAFGQEHGIDLSQSYFYTDSINDQEMLERVGHPRIVNPDARLRLLALRRRWPIEDFRH